MLYVQEVLLIIVSHWIRMDKTSWHYSISELKTHQTFSMQEEFYSSTIKDRQACYAVTERATDGQMDWQRGILC